MKKKEKKTSEISEVENLVLEVETQEEKQIFTKEEVDILLKEQKESETDKYLRLLAEFDNYKKRTQKEKEEIKNSTKVNMISSILDLDSDLAIALKNSKVENEGLNILVSKLNTFLKNQGIEPIQTDTYDSDLHEVISVLEIGEQKVIDVVSKGYTLNGQPFRFPKIILGK